MAKIRAKKKDFFNNMGMRSHSSFWEIDVAYFGHLESFLSTDLYFNYFKFYLNPFIRF